jgi:adenylate kinase family enzyme
LEGFPQTEAQINLLKSLKIKPSLVCMFEQPEAETIRRLKNRRMDLETGIFYNMELNAPSDDAVIKRLYEMTEDKEEIVKLRLKTWQGN